MSEKIEDYSRDQLIKILVNEGLEFEQVVRLKRKELILIFNQLNTDKSDKETMRKKSEALIKNIEIQKNESIINMLQEDKPTDASEELYRSHFFFEISANERISASNCIIKRGTLMKYSTGKKPEVTLNHDEIKPIKLVDISSVFKEPARPDLISSKSIENPVSNITSKSNSIKLNPLKKKKQTAVNTQKEEKEKKEVTFQTSFTEFSFEPIIKPTMKEKEVVAKSNEKQVNKKSNNDHSPIINKEIKEKANEINKDVEVKPKEKIINFKAKNINEKVFLFSKERLSCPFEKSNFFNRYSSNNSKDTNESSSLFKKHSDVSRFNFQNKFNIRSNLVKSSAQCDAIKEETELSRKKDSIINIDDKVVNEHEATTMNKQREDFINLKSFSKINLTPSQIIRLTPVPRSSRIKDDMLDFIDSGESKNMSDDTRIWFFSLAAFSVVSGVFLGITQLLSMNMAEFDNIFNFVQDYRNLGIILLSVIVLFLIRRYLNRLFI